MSLPVARLIAASTLSFGILTLLAFWKQRRRAGLVAGSGPPVFTAMAISFPMRVNCLAIRSHRANMVCFLTSNMRPIVSFLYWYWGAKIKQKKPPQKKNFGAVNEIRGWADGSDLELAAVPTEGEVDHQADDHPYKGPEQGAAPKADDHGGA